MDGIKSFSKYKKKNGYSNIGCFNTHGAHVTASKSTTNNFGVLFIFILSKL